MSETRVHFDTFPEKSHGITRCGIEFWRSKSGSDEGETALNRRIEFVGDPKRVTCKRCKNGMESDWRLAK